MDKYQTIGRRIGAAVIDSIIIVPVNWGIIMLLAANTEKPSFLPWALAGFVSSSYYILMHYYRGQTIGKMAVGVKVLDRSETAIDLGQAIMRSLPQLLVPLFVVSSATAADHASVELWYGITYGSTVLFSLLNAIVCLASFNHRALHDFIAGTVVVRTDV